MFARLTIVILLTYLVSACDRTPSENKKPKQKIPIAKKFSFPIGPDRVITQKRDKADQWYNARDFGEDNHLGEDWNKNSGGNTDCGEPVYAAANGWIVSAGDSGVGWGNVILITHELENGKKYQTLYGHLKEITKKKGVVRRREKIGTIGNAEGYYLCHLHFELRDETSPQWDKVYSGYSTNRDGWLDPSEFIRKHQ